MTQRIIFTYKFEVPQGVTPLLDRCSRFACYAMCLFLFQDHVRTRLCI